MEDQYEVTDIPVFTYYALDSPFIANYYYMGDFYYCEGCEEYHELDDYHGEEIED